MQIFATTYEASDAMKSSLAILDFMRWEAAHVFQTINGGGSSIGFTSAEALARLPRIC